MLNILDFFDSRDIREFNRNTQFTPLEQAVIIYHSLNTSAASKLVAWNELLEKYDDSDFLNLSYGRRDFGDPLTKGIRRTNRQIVSDYVRACEKTLAEKDCSAGAVYVASFWEQGFESVPHEELFSTFGGAYSFIAEEKRDYAENANLSNCRIGASITKKMLDTPYGNEERFCFNHDLMLYEVIPAFSNEKYSDWGMDSFFVSIPLPFKKGDILKTTWDKERLFGVLSNDLGDDYFRFAVESGDSSDFVITLEQYFQSNGEWVFSYDHFSPWYLEKCGDAELPDDQIMLLYLRDAFRDSDNLPGLIELFTMARNHDSLYDEIIAGRKAEIGRGKE